MQKLFMLSATAIGLLFSIGTQAAVSAPAKESLSTITKDCISLVKKSEHGFTVLMSDGGTIDFERGSDGRVFNAKMGGPAAQGASHQAHTNPEATEDAASDSISKEPSFVALRARVRAALSNALKQACSAYAGKKERGTIKSLKPAAKTGPSRAQTAPHSGDLTDDGGATCDGDEETGGLECGSEGGGSGGGDSGGNSSEGGSGSESAGGSADAQDGGVPWTMEDAQDFAGSMVDSDFEVTMANFSAAIQRQPILACGTVVQQCRETCASLGTLETSACVALAAAASLALTPSIGGAAGIYCAGKVWVATEQCKNACNTPTVPCSR